MTFWGHVEELRARLFKCLAFYILACVGVYPAAGKLLDILTAPVGSLVFLSPVDAFSAFWGVVLWGGVFAASPYFLYHFWTFVGAGLRAEERKIIRLYGILSIALFLAGAVFAFMVVLPMSMQFFLSYATARIHPLISIDRYSAYASSLVWSFAASFELPLVMFVLARVGVATPQWLAGKRRYAIVAILIAAAFLTPPDVVSQVILAVPLLVLYELGIVLARAGAKLRDK